MELGIFAKVFQRENVQDVLEAVRSHGMHCTQFNLVCLGMPTLPQELDIPALQKLEQAVAAVGIKVSALSGTFNMIHPDEEERERGFRGLENLARAVDYMGTKVITLCTGTRSQDNMWQFHPDNNTKQAWNDLVESMERALEIAVKYGVVMGIEPELSNVVNSAEKARRLLDTFATPHLGIIMDGANLIAPDRMGEMHATLDEAFTLLGKDIILAHAKDLSLTAQVFVAPGRGDFDFPYYFSLLRSHGYSGPVIMHGLSEAEVPESYAAISTLLEKEG
jgi:sugar phosphate isomerase/epimerase